LKARRILGIPFVWRGRFPEVVTQGGGRHALERLGEHRFGTVLFQARSGVEPVELRVCEGKEHAIGARSGGWE
jgi:hypothetical protein